MRMDWEFRMLKADSGLGGIAEKRMYYLKTPKEQIIGKFIFWNIRGA